jgi:tagatose-1,6-bisphosphate aldolase
MSLLDFDWRSKKKRMMAMELAEAAVAVETKKVNVLNKLQELAGILGISD